MRAHFITAPTRLVVLALLVTAAVILLMTPATAAVVSSSGGPAPGGGSASGSTNGHGVIVGVDNSGSPVAQSGGAAKWRCTYRRVGGLGGLPPGIGPSLRRSQLELGLTYWRRCEHLVTHQLTFRRITATAPIESVPGRAEQDAPAPQIAMSPDPSVGTVVGIPTWLWVDNFTPSQPLFLTNGSVSVLARLFPQFVIWDMDDASTPAKNSVVHSDTVRCDGPGVRWSAETELTTPVDDLCTYSFRHRGVHHVTATIWWSVAYFDTLTSQLRYLPPVSSSTTVDTNAVELDTVIRVWVWKNRATCRTRRHRPTSRRRASGSFSRSRR